MFLGEMLIAIDLEGEEAGDVSKCMLDVGCEGFVYTRFGWKNGSVGGNVGFRALQ